MTDPFISHNELLVLQYKIFASILLLSTGTLEIRSIQRNEQGIEKLLKTLAFVMSIIVSASPFLVL